MTSIFEGQGLNSNQKKGHQRASRYVYLVGGFNPPEKY